MSLFHSCHCFIHVLMFCSVRVADLPSLIRPAVRFTMPNGNTDGYCRHCREWKLVHQRVEEDYRNFHGWYCDDCFDWIEADDQHWRLHALMCMVDKQRSHPLFNMISCPALGHAIAAFAWGPVSETPFEIAAWNRAHTLRNCPFR